MNALCGADGKTWFTVGYAAFPVEDPVQVSLHAIGLRRTLGVSSVERSAEPSNDLAIQAERVSS